MHRRHIKEELEKSTRWGCNLQPDLEDFLDNYVLAEFFEHEIKSVEVLDPKKGDTVVIILQQVSPTFEQGLRIGIWADTVEWNEKKKLLRFWWD